MYLAISVVVAQLPQSLVRVERSASHSIHQRPDEEKVYWYIPRRGHSDTRTVTHTGISQSQGPEKHPYIPKTQDSFSGTMQYSNQPGNTVQVLEYRTVTTTIPTPPLAKQQAQGTPKADQTNIPGTKPIRRKDLCVTSTVLVLYSYKHSGRHLTNQPTGYHRRRWLGIYHVPESENEKGGVLVYGWSGLHHHKQILNVQGTYLVCMPANIGCARAISFDGGHLGLSMVVPGTSTAIVWFGSVKDGSLESP
ncbi:hypothetical protein HOY82DRAFT_540992 [Tuber indicum]|nr:hypothetical protein HOY82DRAFT_540992 [Tuber indicum]